MCQISGKHLPPPPGMRSPFKFDEFFRTCYGPTQRTLDALDRDEQAVLRKDPERLWAERNQAANGTTQVEGEYLEVIATRD